ncbi:uncharacterized protein LOC113468591 [Diaphorina citri]|uniref:Uncharacterized protein LOC113468591 n=1 Tax=Diaphorina citri TaxID=121845 RepID=A0A3Q0J3Y7_DIACI|nr:uncharacterized protein LOC113468591 [Diaphorina citri]
MHESERNTREHAVFALRQNMMEVHRDKPLVFVFIDLEKAYDRVPREEIWKCMRAKGTPEKYVRIVRDMYEDVVTKVRSSVGVTEEIPVQQNKNSTVELWNGQRTEATSGWSRAQCCGQVQVPGISGE